MREKVDLNLTEKEISTAILLRLKAYYDSQVKIKEFLGKRYIAAGADFFVETILFYLKLILEKTAPDFQVFSEKSIKQRRGSLRPDISIWKCNEVKAIIECKTQLGWNRDRWEEDFKKREDQLRKSYPNAKAYLLVMTLANWAGFGINCNVGKKYFVLSKCWPTDINEDIKDVIVNPFEVLANDLLCHLGVKTGL